MTTKKITICRLVTLILLDVLMAAPVQAAVTKGDYSDLWLQFAASRQCWDNPAAHYPYEECFLRAAGKYDLPLNLLLAVARGESDFNPRAESKADCYGIMQIRWPDTARELGFRSLGDLYDPCRNIMAGSHYLRKMLDIHNGNIHLALAAYNHGPGRIPAGMNIGQLPDRAKWYSGYIYHHLEKVAGRERLISKSPGRPGQKKQYRVEHKAPIIFFNAPFRALGFIDHVAQYAPMVRLDWFRNSLGRYCVVLLYSSDKELQRSVPALKHAGYRLDISLDL